MWANITDIMVIAAAIFFAVLILSFGLYIAFFPLVKTIQGGFSVCKEYWRILTEHRKTPAWQLGVTMADGGEKVDTRNEDT